jgi:hypothetical protein
MSWRGVRCKECDRYIGCPYCGQLLPNLKMVSETIDSKEVYFCTSECRDKWKVKQKNESS